MHKVHWIQREEANTSYFLVFFHTSKDKWALFGVAQMLHWKSLSVLVMDVLSGTVLAPVHWIPVTSTLWIKNKHTSSAKGVLCVGREPLSTLTGSKHLPAGKPLSSLWETNRNRVVLSRWFEALKIGVQIWSRWFWLVINYISLMQTQASHSIKIAKMSPFYSSIFFIPHLPNLALD